MAWAGYNRALLMWFANFLLQAISVITSYSYKTQLEIWIKTLAILSTTRSSRKTVSMSCHNLNIIFIFIIGKFWYDLFLALITHIKACITVNPKQIFAQKQTFFETFKDTRVNIFLSMLFKILGSAMRQSLLILDRIASPSIYPSHWVMFSETTVFVAYGPSCISSYSKLYTFNLSFV